jgi:hypothetical protein
MGHSDFDHEFEANKASHNATRVQLWATKIVNNVKYSMLLTRTPYFIILNQWIDNVHYHIRVPQESYVLKFQLGVQAI